MATVTQFYIEKVRSKMTAENRLEKPASDYLICKTLGISSGGMTNYTKHNREADDEVSYKIAEYLEISPFEIIAKIHVNKAKTPQTKAIWSALLRSELSSKHCILCSIQQKLKNLVDLFSYPTLHALC